MKLLLICLIIINIGLLSAILRKYTRNDFILKSVSIIIMTFIIEYTIGSVILLATNKFGIGRVIIGTSIVNIILVIYQIIKGNIHISSNKNIKLSVSDNTTMKTTIAVIGIIILLLPFVWKKAEFIYPSQDGGVYALKSIDLLYGDTKNVKELLEYGLVADDEKLKILDFQKNQIGLYEKSKTDETYFYDYHGLPTWPSLMALSGKIFGTQNIAGILTLLFCLILIFLYYILDELKVNKLSQILAIMIFGFSPLTIYLAKHSLSEMFWTTMLMFAILTIMNKSKPINIIGAIALGLLGFIHVETFMYMPLFVGILFALQIVCKKRIYGVINIIFNVLFILSLGYGCIVSKTYFVAQYSGSLGLYLGIHNELAALIAISILNMASIIAATLIIYNESFSKFIKNIWDKVYPYIFKICKYALIIILVCLIYKACRLGFTVAYKQPGPGAWALRPEYADEGIYSLVHLNVFSILEATSYIILPIIIYKVLKIKITDNKMVIFLIPFIYTFAIYTVIRIDTPMNYYASRYFFVVLIPSIVILFSLIQIPDRLKKIILIITILVNIPFNVVQFNGQEFKGNLQMVEDAVSVIVPNSIVLIDPKARPDLYTTNLRERNNNLVFPIDIKLDGALTKDKQIYIISNGDYPENYPTAELSQVLMKDYEVNGDISSFHGIYPLKHRQDNEKISIYKVNK